MERRKKEDKRIPVDFVISTLNRGGAENKLVAVANGIDKKKYFVRVGSVYQEHYSKQI